MTISHSHHVYSRSKTFIGLISNWWLGVVAVGYSELASPKRWTLPYWFQIIFFISIGWELILLSFRVEEKSSRYQCPLAETYHFRRRWAWSLRFVRSRTSFFFGRSEIIRISRKIGWNTTESAACWGLIICPYFVLHTPTVTVLNIISYYWCTRETNYHFTNWLGRSITSFRVHSDHSDWRESTWNGETDFLPLPYIDPIRW